MTGTIASRIHLTLTRLCIGMAVIAAVVMTAPHMDAQAAGRNDVPIVIRDQEIEDMLRIYAKPIFEQAGLADQPIRFVLIQDRQINAFVAGGLNIFIYTGLLMASDRPEEIIGVIAHETGHIAGGHLIRTHDAMANASMQSMLMTLLGIATAIGTGESAAATAISAGGQQMALRNFLTHSRSNESSADQAAVNYLEGSGITVEGLKSFMQKLEDQELLPASRQSEYIRTHPLSRDRIEFFRHIAEDSDTTGQKVPPAWYEAHSRMKAKLVGYITPERVPLVYPDSDTSISARYARAIAAYRQSRIDDALAELDTLIADEPQNPYFYELKGQTLLDHARVEEAITAYRKSVELMPMSGLLRTALAHALLEVQTADTARDKALLDEAIENLLIAQRRERRSTTVQRLLATAYGRRGEEAMAQLHLAEEALLQQNLPFARRMATSASRRLEEGSNAWLKAQDILRAANGLKDDEDQAADKPPGE